MAESQMNKLAEKLGMDPVMFRLKNALREGDTLDVQTSPPGPVTAVQVIEAAAKKAGWTESSQKWKGPVRPQKEGITRKGIGFAAGFK